MLMMMSMCFSGVGRSLLGRPPQKSPISQARSYCFRDSGSSTPCSGWTPTSNSIWPAYFFFTSKAASIGSVRTVASASTIVRQ